MKTKKYCVSFNRDAIYTEHGYLTVSATSPQNAKRIAIEILENNDTHSLIDNEGDISDIDLNEENQLDDPNIEITCIDVDDISDDEYEEDTL